MTNEEKQAYTEYMKRYAMLYQVKEGRKAVWEEWCAERDTTERFDAVQTLRDKRIIVELALAQKLEGKEYVIIYREGEMEEGKEPFTNDSELTLMISECLLKISDSRLLYHLRAD